MKCRIAGFNIASDLTTAPMVRVPFDDRNDLHESLRSGMGGDLHRRNQALQTPEVAQQMAAEGAVPMPVSSKEFGDPIAREIPRWAEVVKAGKVTAD